MRLNTRSMLAGILILAFFPFSLSLPLHDPCHGLPLTAVPHTRSAITDNGNDAPAKDDFCLACLWSVAQHFSVRGPSLPIPVNFTIRPMGPYRTVVTAPSCHHWFAKRAPPEGLSL